VWLQIGHCGGGSSSGRQAGSLGLAAIFNISEVALLAIKYLGVAYLFYTA